MTRFSTSNSSANNRAASLSTADSKLSSKYSCFPDSPDPNLCCQSGCSNCVWINYANEVSQHLHEHHAEEAKTPEERWKKIDKLLDEKVHDPMLKTYLEMEIKYKIFNE
ncbi:Oxidoreductase-like domain-containing protein 1 isoform X1 [Aphelenchoides besseyi]|nr:Oxidoreductase-like domain-containing protein 1 isoform X1 [Aphelenchoides besseyi]KAI6195458.1 Oxidoreductase-like domain-containing protein 1 isoform X1 [Aphelenchoides besseyi]